MLSGVGGNTVEEAKQRLTYAEALKWFAYVRKHGTPNQHLHQGFAMIAAIVTQALGGKAEMKDFMLRTEQPVTTEDEDEATIEDVFKLLTGRTK